MAIVISLCRCPDGYRIGKLEPHHAELVATRWPYRTSFNKVSWFQKLIENFLTVAAFCDDEPVAWILQYSHGGIGNLYTMESHRRRGLGLAVTAAMCQLVLEKCPEILLWAMIVPENTVSKKMFESLGFVYSEHQTYFFNIERS